MEKTYENRSSRTKVLSQALIIGISCFSTLAVGMALLVNILSRLVGSFDFKAILCFTFIGIGIVFILTELIGFAIAYMMNIIQ